VAAERLASLRQVTTIESAGSSTRIEGAQLSDDEVARVLQGKRVDSFRERDEAEVRSYAELLQTIFDHYPDIPLTENYIKQLHKILLGHVEKDERHRGEYKKLDNHVEARHLDGRVEIIFRTASPFDTPRLMADLVSATNEALGGEGAHPLVIIARFVVDFLAIHPFQDGNGRLSRAVTTLLMLRAGYEYVPYASVERLIEDHKVAYYHALRTSQTAMLRDPSDFGAWLIFLLRVLQSQKRILADSSDSFLQL
jgi:Fic family protein